MNKLLIKETKQKLTNKLKEGGIARGVSKLESNALTNSLICPRCGGKKIEPEIKSEIKEIKELLILIIGKQKLVSEVSTPWPNEKELLKEYQEAWSDPRRLTEFKQWEQAAINDWVARIGTKKTKKK